MTSIPGQEPGGFLPEAILSPPPSSVTSSSIASATLPRSRAHPLKQGSGKETSFRNYVDKGILHITRRYAKKRITEPTVEGEVKGYMNFREVGPDIEKLVDIVWVSGTPSLQTSYLLSLALLLASYLPAFPPAPRTMFQLLHKMDYAFASLLQGRDIESGEALPGFTNTMRTLSTTEKVRLKSLVERTRLVVVEVMRSGDVEEEAKEDTETDIEYDDEDMEDEVEHVERWDMEIARVYDKTLVELGESIGDSFAGM
ncbi:MAG: hypothetical protein M1827_001379 [Pycnora praestabilis]|nr:MAG: hypothetical protein M1827_001379 [Pycnora praestabilis]